MEVDGVTLSDRQTVDRQERTRIEEEAEFRAKRSKVNVEGRHS